MSSRWIAAISLLALLVVVAVAWGVYSAVSGPDRVDRPVVGSAGDPAPGEPANGYAPVGPEVQELLRRAELLVLAAGPSMADREQALELYRRALELDPGNVFARNAIERIEAAHAGMFNARAASVGQNARIASMVFYQDNPSFGMRYPESVEELLAIDPQLNSDPEIIFVWTRGGRTGFEFTTSHARGTKSFVFRE